MSTQPEQEPWAAQRDASWYDRPDVRSDKRVHIGRPDGWSRCGRSFLDDEMTWVPGDVDDYLRCQSTGCRQAWPTADDPQRRTGYRLVRRADEAGEQQR